MALALAFGGGGGVRAQIPSPIQTPKPAPDITLNPVPPSPSPSPAPVGRRGRGRAPATSGPKSPEPTATPTSPAYASLDGSWEVQVQYSDHTTYSYFDLRQTKDTLAGTWKYDGKSYTFDGTYDGRLIRIVAKLDKGPVTLSGYVENASDMVGLVDFGGGKTVAFTAEHRAAPNKNILKRGVEPGSRRGRPPSPSPVKT